MDTNYEDRMYRQIEDNLSNNINEELFTSIRNHDNKGRDSFSLDSEDMGNTAVMVRDETDNAYETFSDKEGGLIKVSRAEYIKKAREACLQQMNMVQTDARTFDTSYIDNASQTYDHSDNNESMNLFSKENAKKDSHKEAIAFKLLMIRTICAVILFLSIFIMDKFEVKVGKFSFEMVREYVIGNDRLKQLEDIIVTWLK